MSKEKSESQHAEPSSRQKFFEKLAAREFKRLRESFRKATAALLAEAENSEELQLRERVSNLAKDLIEITQGMIDFPLFEETRGKTNWDLYLSGLRGLLRDFLKSHYLTAILPVLGAKELGEKLTAFSQEGLELLHLTETVLRELDHYVDARVQASETTSAYQVENETLEAVYASLKTWEKEKELQRFSETFEALLEKTLVVIVEGPIHLYLMISREGFLLIFKAMMLKRIGDRSLEDKDLDSLMVFHDQVYKRIEEAKSIRLLQDLFRRILEEYLADWRKKQRQLRELFPTQELKESFVERFERGTIFGKVNSA